MAIVQQGLTLDQFLELPEQEPALEYEDGVVTQKVAPKGRHSALQAELAEHVNRFGRRRRVARAFPELRTSFAGASYVPDVAVYRWERIPADPAGDVADDCREPPDIAIEIASPGQSANALVRRCAWYVEHGVQVALLVDPEDRSVLVFRPGAPIAVRRGVDAIDLDDVVPGMRLTVRQLFASLRAR